VRGVHYIKLTAGCKKWRNRSEVILHAPELGLLLLTMHIRAPRSLFDLKAHVHAVHASGIKDPIIFSTSGLKKTAVYNALRYMHINSIPINVAARNPGFHTSGYM
jgi:hypothetical protein